MKIIKIFIALSITLIFLTGCQNVRENLSMKKKKSVDEFLIEKKNPLVLPPEFSELPKEAQHYINFIEEFIEAKISTISTSPERKDTILILDPFKS